MKGVVFVELMSMAEEAFGEDVVDNVLDKIELESGGAYTTVGNYPCEELVKIVEGFSAHSGIAPDVLQRKFGHWMMGFFEAHYPGFFENKKTSFEMLESVDQEIHVEVRKLYPDAELPKFETERPKEGTLEMTYTSPRPLVSFCHGLIESCVDRFGEKAEIAFAASPTQEGSTVFKIDVAKG